MRTYFRWMGAYWSCTAAAWEHLNEAIAQEQPFDLGALGCRELACRPKGNILALRDTVPRVER